MVCIQSKALLESSERYVEAQKHLAEHGVTVKGVSLDLSKMLARKDKIVKGLTDGVAHLLKKNGVERIDGHGSLNAKTDQGYTVDIDTPKGTRTISGKHVIIATGSKVADLPGVDRSGDKIGGSTEALDYPEVPEHLVVIGAGLSVTSFFRFPLVTLASINLKRPSASDFWARATVIGAGLSVTKFLRFPLVTFCLL